MSYFKAISFSGAVTGIGCGLYLLGEKIKENFPPSEEFPEVGSKVFYEGKSYVLIGWFGADNTVFKKGIDKERGLYYGCPKTAQVYAIVL